MGDAEECVEDRLDACRDSLGRSAARRSEPGLERRTSTLSIFSLPVSSTLLTAKPFAFGFLLEANAGVMEPTHPIRAGVHTVRPITSHHLTIKRLLAFAKDFTTGRCSILLGKKKKEKKKNQCKKRRSIKTQRSLS